MRKVDVERPFRDVYRRLDLEEEREAASGGGAAAHAAHTWRRRQLERARALAPFLPPGCFLSGRTAAVIWRLPVPVADSEDLEVACFSPGRALRRRGVRGSRVDPRFVTVTAHEGLPVTDAVSTWCMLATRLGRWDAVALGDSVIRQPRIPGTRHLTRAPHATLEELERAAAAPYRRGRESLLGMLPNLSPHSASAPESHLRLALAEWGVPEPALDFDVFDGGGVLLGCSEIAFPDYRVAHEYEGAHHMTETAQWNRDIHKYRAYARNGWDVIRVTAELLYRRRDELREQTFDALAQRGWVPSR